MHEVWRTTLAWHIGHFEQFLTKTCFLLYDIGLGLAISIVYVVRQTLTWRSILALMTSPFDKHGAWAAESKSRWCMLRKNFWSGSLAYKSTLEKQYFIVSEPKVEVISSKIDRVAAIYTSKFKWAWRAQFLSRTLQILEIN